LKPENVFLSKLDQAEVVKIMDFGIAKILRESPDQTSDSRTAPMAGTLRYMSPEQLRGCEVSPRWDLWALSVISYEALCGTVPFAGDSVGALEGAIRGVQFAPVSEHRPEAPASWQGYFERLFAASEAERPASIGEFWELLQACAHAET
jgi:serine/threonine-protein kinase